MRHTAHSSMRQNRLYLLGFFWLLSNILLTACSSSAVVHPSATTSPMGNNTSTVHTSPTMSPTPLPVLDNGTVPSSRKSTQIIYDPKTHSLLLFGGNEHIGGRDVNDTWTWDGVHWMQLHPENSPSPREGASLAYNSDTGQVVLFGGLDPDAAPVEKPLNDTWIWNGSNWTQMRLVVSPPARLTAAMVYDPATKQIVLFGGGGDGPLARNQTFPALNDTWTWDGSNWTQQQPANVPPARQIPNMAYHAITHTVVLFGGFNYNTGQQLLDTWTWDGTNWTQLHPVLSPSASLIVKGEGVSFDNFASMIYDDTTQRTMLMCIGYDTASEKQWFEAIWLWDGSNWTRQVVLGPNDGFEGGVIAYDTDLHTVIQLSAYLPKNSRGEFSYIFIDKLWKWTGQDWVTLDAWDK